jgi:hypothetical protein
MTPGKLQIVAVTPDRQMIRVSGQTARTLAALIEAGPSGCTALECSTWALRFAAYCHELKRRHGLVIETRREDHPGGWHGRHILHSPVRIIARSDRPNDIIDAMPCREASHAVE